MSARKILPLILLLALALTGCTSAGDRTGPTNTPTGGANAQPQQTAPAAMSSYDWQTRSQEVENALTNLSEVGEARVVVTGNTALVGLRFNDQYRGDNTERIREMVSGVVKKADPTIETVAVTSEDGDVDKVFDISDKVRAGERFDDFKDDINTVVRNATTLR